MLTLAPLGSRGQAPEDWRTPRRFAYFRNHRVARSVLGCGGPPPLFPEAYQTVTMLTGTAIEHNAESATKGHPICGPEPFTVLLALWGADLASPSHVSFARRCWCATLCPSAWDLALEEPSRLRG